MEFLGFLLRNIRDDAPLYLVLVVYTVAGLAFLALTGNSHLAAYSIYLAKWAAAFLLFFPLLALSLRLAGVFHRFDKRRRLAFRRVFSARHTAHFASGLCFVLALMIFQGTFTSVKNGLSAWTGGFPYDRQLADWDAALYFGTDPWRLLYAVADPHYVLGIVEWNYNTMWFVLCFGALFHVATAPGAAIIRTRYLVSFMLVWAVVGNLAAGTLVSAGPAFYGMVTGDHARFAEQLAVLAHHADRAGSAASYQAYLWTLHEKGMTGFASGISAFPSVHVGLVAMNAFFLAERSRLLGTTAFAYLGVIQASSVYLAWHYSLDGYVAIVIAAAIYYTLRMCIPASRTERMRPTGRALSLPPGASVPLPKAS